MIAMSRAVRASAVATTLLWASCLTSVQTFAAAQEHTPATQTGQPQQPHSADEQKDAKEAPIPPEKSSVTHHDLSMGGKSLKYTATAGTLLIRDEEDKPYGSMFYVAYTLDGAEAGTRAVSFLYNGGPGAATLWLHMGSL